MRVVISDHVEACRFIGINPDMISNLTVSYDPLIPWDAEITVIPLPAIEHIYIESRPGSTFFDLVDQLCSSKETPSS